MLEVDQMTYRTEASFITILRQDDGAGEFFELSNDQGEFFSVNLDELEAALNAAKAMSR